MGLPVNLQSDWKQIEESSQKKEQFFTPLKSIERQLISVLKNPNKTEMEQQMFPLIATAKDGDGTVLLQNHLGDFGLEKLLLRHRSDRFPLQHLRLHLHQPLFRLR